MLFFLLFKILVVRILWFGAVGLGLFAYLGFNPSFPYCIDTMAPTFAASGPYGLYESSAGHFLYSYQACVNYQSGCVLALNGTITCTGTVTVVSPELTNTVAGFILSADTSFGGSASAARSLERLAAIPEDSLTVGHSYTACLNTLGALHATQCRQLITGHVAKFWAVYDDYFPVPFYCSSSEENMLANIVGMDRVIFTLLGYSQVVNIPKSAIFESPLGVVCSRDPTLVPYFAQTNTQTVSLSLNIFVSPFYEWLKQLYTSVRRLFVWKSMSFNFSGTTWDYGYVHIHNLYLGMLSRMAGLYKFTSYNRWKPLWRRIVYKVARKGIKLHSAGKSLLPLNVFNNRIFDQISRLLYVGPYAHIQQLYLGYMAYSRSPFRFILRFVVSCLDFTHVIDVNTRILWALRSFHYLFGVFMTFVYSMGLGIFIEALTVVLKLVRFYRYGHLLSPYFRYIMRLPNVFVNLLLRGVLKALIQLVRFCSRPTNMTPHLTGPGAFVSRSTVISATTHEVVKVISKISILSVPSSDLTCPAEATAVPTVTSTVAQTVDYVAAVPISELPGWCFLCGLSTLTPLWRFIVEIADITVDILSHLQQLLFACFRVLLNWFLSLRGLDEGSWVIEYLLLLLKWFLALLLAMVPIACIIFMFAVVLPSFLLFRMNRHYWHNLSYLPGIWKKSATNWQVALLVMCNGYGVFVSRIVHNYTLRKLSRHMVPFSAQLGLLHSPAREQFDELVPVVDDDLPNATIFFLQKLAVIRAGTAVPAGCYTQLFSRNLNFHQCLIGLNLRLLIVLLDCLPLNANISNCRFVIYRGAFSYYGHIVQLREGPADLRNEPQLPVALIRCFTNTINEYGDLYVGMDGSPDKQEMIGTWAEGVIDGSEATSFAPPIYHMDPDNSLFLSGHTPDLPVPPPEVHLPKKTKGKAKMVDITEQFPALHARVAQAGSDIESMPYSSVSRRNSGAVSPLGSRAPTAGSNFSGGSQPTAGSNTPRMVHGAKTPDNNRRHRERMQTSVPLPKLLEIWRSNNLDSRNVTPAIHGHDKVYIPAPELFYDTEVIRKELSDRGVNSISFTSHNVNSNGHCYINLLPEFSRTAASMELGFCPSLADFFDYVDANSLDCTDGAVLLVGNFVHIKNDVDRQKGSIKRLRYLAQTGKYFIGYQVSDDMGYLRLDVHGKYKTAYTVGVLAAFAEFAALALVLAATSMAFYTIHEITYYFIGRILTIPYNSWTDYGQHMDNLHNLHHTYFEDRPDYDYGLHYTILCLAAIMIALVACCNQLLFRFVIFLLTCGLRESLLMLKGRFSLRRKLTVICPNEWFVSITDPLKPRSMKHTMASLIKPGDEPDRVRAAYIVSQLIGNGETFPLNTYSYADFCQRRRLIKQDFKIRNIKQSTIPVTLPYRAPKAKIPSTLVNSQIAHLESALKLVIAGDKGDVFTEHQSNYVVYTTVINYIYGKIPSGSVVKDVGSNVAHAPIQGYILNAPSIDAKDGLRASNMSQAINAKRTNGLYPDISTADYLGCHTRCTHLIFNFVHDIPFPALFMKARELGATEIYMTMAVTPNMLVFGNAYLDVEEQSYMSNEDAMRAYFPEAGEPYTHKISDYYSPLFVSKVTLPNGESYVRAVARQFSNIMLFHYSLTTNSSNNAELQVTGVNEMDYKYIAINATMSWNGIFEGKLIRVSQEAYTRIITMELSRNVRYTIQQRIHRIAKTLTIVLDVNAGKGNSAVNVSTKDFDEMELLVKTIIYSSENMNPWELIVVNSMFKRVLTFLIKMPLFQKFLSNKVIYQMLIMNPSSVKVIGDTLDLTKVTLKSKDKTNSNSALVHDKAWYNSSLAYTDNFSFSKLLINIIKLVGLCFVMWWTVFFFGADLFMVSLSGLIYYILLGSFAKKPHTKDVKTNIYNPLNKDLETSSSMSDDNFEDGFASNFDTSTTFHNSDDLYVYHDNFAPPNRYSISNHEHLVSTTFSLTSSNMLGDDFTLREHMIGVKRFSSSGLKLIGSSDSNIIDCLAINSDYYNKLIYMKPEFLSIFLGKIESMNAVFILTDSLLYTNSKISEVKYGDIICIMGSANRFRRVSTSDVDGELRAVLASKQQVCCQSAYLFLQYLNCGLEDCGSGQCWRKCLGLLPYNTTNVRPAYIKETLKALFKLDVQNENICVITDSAVYNYNVENNRRFIYADNNGHCFLLNSRFVTICTWSLQHKRTNDIRFGVDGPLFAKHSNDAMFTLEQEYNALLQKLPTRSWPCRAILEYVHYIKEMEIQTLSSFTLYHEAYGFEEAKADKKIQLYDNVGLRFVNAVIKEKPQVAWDGMQYVKFLRTTLRYDTTSRYVICHENINYLRERNLLSLINRHHTTLKQYNWSRIHFENVVGVPGCGKTTEIKQQTEVDKANGITFLVLTATRANALEYYSNQHQPNRRFRTYDSLFTSKLNMECDNLYCDECFMVHSAEIFIAAFLTKARRVIMVGDTKQIPFVSRVISFSVKYEQFISHNVLYRYTTHRIPESHLPLLKTFYPEIRSSNTVTTYFPKVIDLRTAEPTIKGYDVLLTFTQFEKAVLREMNPGQLVHTVHEVEGNTYNKVALVRTVKHENLIYDSIPHIIVGCTRHRLAFDYHTVNSSDKMSAIIRLKFSEYDRDQSFVAASHYSPTRLKDVWFEEEILTANNFCYAEYSGTITDLLCQHEAYDVSILKQRCDAVEYTVDLPDNVPLETMQDFMDVIYERADFDTRYRLMEESLLSIPPKIRINYEKFCNQLLQPEGKITMDAQLHTPQPPRHRGELGVVIEALKTRNFNPPILYLCRAASMVDKVADRFMNVFIDQENFQLAMRDVDYNNGIWRHAWLRERNRNQKGLLNNTDPTTVRGNIYDSILRPSGKAKLDNSHNVKLTAPQVVTAQNPYLTFKYSNIAKQFNYAVRRSLKSKWLINDGYSIDELSALVNNFLFNLSSFRGLEVDFSKYDKSQEMLCLRVFIAILKRFGVPTDFLDEWEKYHITNVLSFRKEGISTKVDYQRRSGDIFTFLANTIIAMCCIAWAYPECKCAIGGVFGGDDSIVFFPTQCHLTDNTPVISDVFNLVAKIEHFPTALSFSSKFLTIYDGYWLFIPDPLKALVKLGRDDIYNEEHRDLYYISFSDNYRCYLSREIRDKAANLTVIRYPLLFKSLTDARTLTEFLGSLIHDKRIFNNLFKTNKYTKKETPSNMLTSILRKLRLTSADNHAKI
nr:MAG: RNA-dependent RNA polymerase [Cosmospora episphaeria virga-like virus 1]